MSEAKQVIVVRKDLNMRKGKIAAQVAHASMKFLVDGYEKGERLNTFLTFQQQRWLQGAFAKVVVYVESEQELLDLIDAAQRAAIDVRSIVDVGRTEFHGVPTLTCAAFGPDESYRLDNITAHLKLL